MRVGVGLPSCVPGCPPDLLLTWSARADEGPFASLGTVDRLLYGNYDPLIALSAAASVTSRVDLVTSILISPVREQASLAKQVLSLDALSGGRLVLGLSVGARKDDYDASEMPFAGRGERLTRQIMTLDDYVEGDAMGPAAADGGPKLLVGGQSGPALARMARLSSGYIHNGGPPRAFARAVGEARAAWADAGREGAPELWGMAYYALGDGVDRGRDYLLDYYAFTGPFAQRIADGLLTNPLEIREFVQGYAEAGCDHLVLFPTVASPDQLDLLADALPG